MAKGITYSFRTNAGYECKRYSAGHDRPVYQFACVVFPIGKKDMQPRKGQVSYSTTREGAIKNAMAYLKPYKYEFEVHSLIHSTGRLTEKLK